MADGDGAAVRVHALFVVRQSQFAGDGQRLRSERLVEFDHAEIVDGEAEPSQELLCGRRGANAHDARRHARRRNPRDPRERRQSVRGDGLFGRHENRSRAVVDP